MALCLAVAVRASLFCRQMPAFTTQPQGYKYPNVRYLPKTTFFDSLLDQGLETDDPQDKPCRYSSPWVGKQSAEMPSALCRIAFATQACPLCGARRPNSLASCHQLAGPTGKALTRQSRNCPDSVPLTESRLRSHAWYGFWDLVP